MRKSKHLAKHARGHGNGYGRGRSQRPSAQWKRRISRRDRRDDNDVQTSFRYGEDAAEDLSILLKRYGYASTFPSAVLAEASAIAEDYLEDETKHFAGRKDLREMLIFTIDGEDARDHDDAISLTVSTRRGERVYHLGVHIADVGHFVPVGSLLDQVAAERGTSVYLPGKVLPMFPPVLSNDICSLREDCSRLTVTGMFDINAAGEVLRADFFRSVIRSRSRLTYNVVEDVLDGRMSLGTELDEVLQHTKALSDSLLQWRLARGALTLETKEQAFVLDEEDVHVRSVYLKDRLMSEGIIEECMLVANREVAKRLARSKRGMYRVHDAPDHEKLEALRARLSQHGIPLAREGSEDPLRESQATTNIWTRTLEQITDPLRRETVNDWILHSLKRAEYASRCTGHYGLALHEYTHFTSPIRRYPDLWAHRLLLGENIREKESSSMQSRGVHLGELAERATYHERKAVECEREYHKIKSIRYVLAEDAEWVYTVSVTGVHPRGHVYARDRRSGIEGMIHRDFFSSSHFEEGEGGGRRGRKSKKRGRKSDDPGHERGRRHDHNQDRNHDGNHLRGEDALGKAEKMREPYKSGDYQGRLGRLGQVGQLGQFPGEERVDNTPELGMVLKVTLERAEPKQLKIYFRPVPSSPPA